MKIIILAGGLGTRLSEYTKKIPKPMVDIHGKPILMHIIESYQRYGFNNFCIALGYKGDVIKKYFLELASLSPISNAELNSLEVLEVKIPNSDLKITLANTGQNTLTGGRLKRLKEYIGNDTFMLTYGDGLSDVNFHQLLSAHQQSKKLVTVTAVHPVARFGELKIDNNNNVTSFKEKPQMQEGWINGGFFVVEPRILDFIDNDKTIFEEEPLEQAAKMNEFHAFKHEGFWYCMDTQRDKDYLENIIDQGTIPWMKI
ncbi:MAG: glucose-1-phosphate cytidylyltransferase [Rickettsiales bacterium TMED289]|nr:MAG: glucose-1-phosphate cytidylyltransferase [Rickettsiales bacterium TMED289]|tara:strand:- start:2994 stop:3764 length:771 start_codon:yes stop_codon:yes gene_type:complete